MSSQRGNRQLHHLKQRLLPPHSSEMRVNRMLGIGQVSVPGTCGEWMQGYSNQFGRVHISAPINWRTTANIIIAANLVDEIPKDAIELRSGTVIIGAVRPRTVELLAALSDGLPPHTIYVSMETSLPVGKGMASSSADLGSAALAYEQARRGVCEPIGLRPRRTLSEVVEIIAKIEPTDAVLFPGIVYAALDSGTLLASYDAPGPLNLIVCVPRESRNTIEVRQHPGQPQVAKSIGDAEFAEFAESCRTKNVAKLGELATKSALANQIIIETPQFDTIHSIAKQYGALGVMVGHSGTAMGVLLEPPPPVLSSKHKEKQPLHRFAEPFLQTSHNDLYSAIQEVYRGDLQLVRIDERGPITMGRS